MDERVTLLAALGAGVFSFLSPCVLPLIPGYLSYVSGPSLGEIHGADMADAPAARRPARPKVLIASLAFAFGFSIVFVALGASANLIGRLPLDRLAVLGRVAGGIIVLFGLRTLGVLRIGVLYRAKRLRPAQPAGCAGATLVGAAFAFGWTPCLGPILAGVLALAGTLETVGEGARLLAAYSLGLAVPFLATSLAVEPFFAASATLRRHYHAIEVTSGVLLIAIGVLIITNQFALVTSWLTP